MERSSKGMSNHRKKLRSSCAACVEILETRCLLASVSGYAFIDSVGDGQRSGEEFGIPGVRLELTNQDGSFSRSTLTSDIGFYAFTNLPAGNYRITEDQPEAVIDGQESTTFPGAEIGNDEISNIVLSEFANATDVNFAEGSIKSSYVSILWVLSSSAGSANQGPMLRELVATAEQHVGNEDLTALIREDAENGATTEPLAFADAYAVTSGNAIEVDESLGVLSNDLSPTGDALTITLLSSPVSGTLTWNPNGSFEYSATAGFVGVDSFTYQAIAADGTRSSPAVVTIDVAAPPNVAPVAVPDAYETNEDTTIEVLAASGVLDNDLDDGEQLTATLVNDVQNGSLRLDSDGGFSYTPGENFVGIDSFTYNAADEEFLSDPVVVTLTVAPVNDAPLVNNDSYVTSENELFAIDVSQGVLVNDMDVEGDAITAIIASDVSNGVLTLAADGSFTYQPNLSFNGIDSFTYLANDGTDSSMAATVVIDVGSVNDAPVANEDMFATDEDVVLSVTTASVLDNDTDVDGDQLSVELDRLPDHGVVSLSDDGTFEYVPNENFHGDDSFTYTATDAIQTSAPATVTITVLPVNDIPTATNDAYEVNQDESLIVDVELGVLNNDNDVENEALTSILVDGPSDGQLTLNSGGSFTYLPDQGFSGIDSFSYQASDGVSRSEVAAVVITVNEVNINPEAADDSYVVDEDQVLIVDVASGLLSNDSGDGLTAELVLQPSNGGIDLAPDGSFTYTPIVDFNGTDTFTYLAKSGTSSSAPATVTITVNPVSDTMAGSVTLGASKDNSLFENPDGAVSNGAGEYLFVGKTLEATNSLRRGLIAFDVGSIPAGATITNVTLTMNMSRTIVDPFDVELRRMTTDWGEGTSDAPREEGTGTDATPNDATWIHSFFDTQQWSTPGGDFAAEASASVSVGDAGAYSWNSTLMIADVQDWLDNPASNTGWMLITDESEVTAKRFDSRENGTEANRPQLVVEYEFEAGPPPGPDLSQAAEEPYFLDTLPVSAHRHQNLSEEPFGPQLVSASQATKQWTEPTNAASKRRLIEYRTKSTPQSSGSATDLTANIADSRVTQAVDAVFEQATKQLRSTRRMSRFA